MPDEEEKKPPLNAATILQLPTELSDKFLDSLTLAELNSFQLQNRQANLLVKAYKRKYRSHLELYKKVATDLRTPWFDKAHILRLFTYVYEGKIEALKKEKIEFEYSSSGKHIFGRRYENPKYLLIDWAQKLNHQEILNYIFQKIQQSYDLEEERYGRSFTYWAIQCHQPLKEIQELYENENELLAPMSFFRSHGKQDNYLHLAIEQNRLDLLEYFIKQGLSLDEKNSKDETPLELAISKGHLNIVEALLKYYGEKKLSATAKTSGKVLHNAILACSQKERSDFSMIDTLLEAEPQLLYQRNEFGQTPLYIAIKQGNMPLIQHLLKFGKFDWTVVDTRGHTLLYAAITAYCSHPQSDFSIIDLLLDAAPQLLDQKLAFYTATHHYNVPLFTHLLEKGNYKLEGYNDHGYTFMHLLIFAYCCNNNSEADDSFPAIDLLLKKSPALLNMKSKDTARGTGHTPLFSLLTLKNANYKKRHALIDYLMKIEGSDLTTVDGHRMTLLHYAVRVNCNLSYSLIDQLLKAAPELLHQKDKNNETPLTWMQKRNFIHEAVHYCTHNKENEFSFDLLFSMAPELLNQLNNEGHTPLFLAVVEGNKKIVKYLLDKNGIDLTVKDKNGDTLLHAVLKLGLRHVETRQAILQCLLEAFSTQLDHTQVLQFLNTINFNDLLKLALTQDEIAKIKTFEALIKDKIENSRKEEIEKAIEILYQKKCTVNLKQEQDKTFCYLDFNTIQDAQFVCDQLNLYFQPNFIFNINQCRLEFPVEQIDKILEFLQVDLNNKYTAIQKLEELNVPEIKQPLEEAKEALEAGTLSSEGLAACQRQLESVPLSQKNKACLHAVMIGLTLSALALAIAGISVAPLLLTGSIYTIGYGAHRFINRHPQNKEHSEEKQKPGRPSPES